MPVEKPVSIGEGRHALFGTLTLPHTEGRFDAVLIWSGSGPTDRDGNLPGKRNNCLKMVAHELALAGYASIRADKRGLGQSEKAAFDEKNLRFETYVEDAIQWAEFLKKVSGVRYVFLLGHSEGGLVCTLVAQKFNALGMVIVDGTGFAASNILREQLLAPDINIPNHLLLEIREILKSLEAGSLVDNISSELEGQFRQSVQPYLMSWFKYDPKLELAKTFLSVLVIQGTTDLQVSLENGRRLATARAGIKFLEIKGMNHVLKDAPKQTALNYATYGKPMLKLASPLMPAITNFIKKAALNASVANDN